MHKRAALCKPLAVALHHACDATAFGLWTPPGSTDLTDSPAAAEPESWMAASVSHWDRACLKDSQAASASPVDWASQATAAGAFDCVRNPLRSSRRRWRRGKLALSAWRLLPRIMYSKETLLCGAASKPQNA